MAALPRLGFFGLPALIVLSTIILSCDCGAVTSANNRYRDRPKIRISSTKDVRYGDRYYVIPSTVHVYGYSYYTTRHLYVTNHNDDPTVCYNDEEFVNGTEIGYFICPTADDTDSATYCCGDEDEQYCCGFWGDYWRAAGVITAIVAVITLVSVLLKRRFCPAKPAVTNRKDTVTSGDTCESVPLARMPTVSVPGSYPYAAPVAGGDVLNAHGYMLQPDGGLPYPPQPGSAAPYPPYPPAAQPQPQPPSYNEAVRL